MEASDTVDRTIRNQRRRGWQILIVAGVWCLVWVGSAITIEYWMFFSGPRYSQDFDRFALIGGLISMLATYVVIIVRIVRLPPKELKLGEQMSPVPGTRIPPKDIRGFHFERDPEEDFDEVRSPIPCCQLTIELRNRKLKMIVSLSDVSHIQEWAERHNIPVLDPQGYTCRNGF